MELGMIWRALFAMIPLGIATQQVGGQELRGLWVDAFNPGLRTSNEVRQVVADARAGGFNAVFVQVRKRGDAYFRGGPEPVAADVAAGFDPLGELIRQSHDTSAGRRRIQVHAWVVAYNIWNQRTSLPPQPNHPFRTHGDWLTRNRTGETWDGSNYAFDPGHPEVQEYTHQVVMDLVNRYPIDGLHWDYIRYGGPDWGYNPEAVSRFNRLHGRDGLPIESDPTWLEFRRQQVTSLVRRTYLESHARRPDLIISAATIAWAPGIQAASQWARSAPNSLALQNWRGWMQEGILDLNIPMIYFRQNERAADWSAWSLFAKDHRYGRGVALGVGGYLNTLSNGLAQARTFRRPTARSAPADGVVFYSRAAPATDATPTQFRSALTSASIHDTNSIPLFSTPSEPWTAPWKTNLSLGHLLGRVTNAAGQGDDGQIVRLQSISDGHPTRTNRTDANGWFGFVDVPPGEWLAWSGLGALSNAMLAKVDILGRRTTERHLDAGWEDPDEDGALTWEEIVAGTDPSVPESRLILVAGPNPSGTTIQVHPWMPGRRYRLQVRTETTGSEWVDFIDRINGPTISIEPPGIMGLLRVTVELE